MANTSNVNSSVPIETPNVNPTVGASAVNSVLVDEVPVALPTVASATPAINSFVRNMPDPVMSQYMSQGNVPMANPYMNSGKKGARLGDTIVASVKEAMPNGKVIKKGKVVYGVVVRAAMQRGRCDGSEVKFDDNAVVLVDKQGQPIGTRVFGPVLHELRKKKHVKILTLAEHIA
ncbi:hypothetical protein EZV62_009122 [Acer yangbiense]|uniref:50S ribosomal protein L14 n=1 Tax=Acer yangbiense TaxID=1000413 RepID=A0A5C7IES8_9ROSI|nr:hypothetical protein EZV62_009122 [Acer yangbiense]